MKFRFRTPHQLPMSWAVDEHALPTALQGLPEAWFELEPTGRDVSGPAPSREIARRAEQVWRVRRSDVVAREDLLIES